MSEHTKGKWTRKSRFLVVNEKGKIIANVQPMATSDQKMTLEESEDNAKLIAAAPATARHRDKLLAACKEIVSIQEKRKRQGVAHYDLRTQSIAKAAIEDK